MAKKSKPISVSASLRDPEKQDGKPALLPKLRFPEFRGDEGWRIATLDSVCEILNNRRRPITGNERTPGPYPYYGASGIVDYVGDFIFDERLLLVGEDGAKWGAFEKTAFIAEGKYWVNNHAHVLKPFAANDTLLESYLTMQDLSPFVTGAAPPKLTLGKLKGIPVPLPPKPAEQQKIAECLSSVDELMAAQSRKVDALKTHKKGLMQQLFPREGETQPRLRFPEFQNAGDWEVDRFDQLLEVIDGDRGANYPKAEDYSQSGFCLFLSAANVSKTGFKFETMQFVSKEKDNALRKGKLKRADVVLTTRGTVGQFAFYSEEIPYENIRINSGMVILRTKAKNIVPEYLYSFTSSEVLNSYIKNTAFGNAQQQLTVGEINKVQLYYPSPPEQQRIAACLTSLDDLIAAQTQKLNALKTHKKALMQQLFPSPEEVQA